MERACGLSLVGLPLPWDQGLLEAGRQECGLFWLDSTFLPSVLEGLG